MRREYTVRFLLNRSFVISERLMRINSICYINLHTILDPDDIVYLSPMVVTGQSCVLHHAILFLLRSDNYAFLHGVADSRSAVGVLQPFKATVSHFPLHTNTVIRHC